MTQASTLPATLPAQETQTQVAASQLPEKKDLKSEALVPFAGSAPHEEKDVKSRALVPFAGTAPNEEKDVKSQASLETAPKQQPLPEATSSIPVQLQALCQHLQLSDTQKALLRPGTADFEILANAMRPQPATGPAMEMAMNPQPTGRSMDVEIPAAQPSPETPKQQTKTEDLPPGLPAPAVPAVQQAPMDVDQVSLASVSTANPASIPTPDHHDDADKQAGLCFPNLLNPQAYIYVHISLYKRLK